MLLFVIIVAADRYLGHEIKASAVQQSLLGTYLFSNKYPYSLSIHNLSRPYPLYKLSSVPSHQLPMSYATKIPNPLFCKPFLKIFNSKTSSATSGKFIFVKRVTFQSIPTKPISAIPTGPSSPSNPGDDDLPQKLKEIVKLFQAVEQPKAKYEQLMFYGRNLKPMDAQYKTAENKVHGCISQVWIRAYLDENKCVVFEADSDTVLTKGLAALLVQGLSGCSAEKISRVSPNFMVRLGLQQSLTQSRSNGLLNMLKLMQRKAQMCVEAEKAGSFSHNEGASKLTEGSNLGVTNDNGDPDFKSRVSSGETKGSDIKAVSDDSVYHFEGVSKPTERSNLGVTKNDGSPDLKTKVSTEETDGSDSKAVSHDNVVLGSRGMRIRDRLERELSPSELHVEDVSYQHGGHTGIRGTGGGETHFNVTAVSEKFEGKSLVKRHRLIYDLLQEELRSGLHALSIVAKTPSELIFM